MPKLRRLIRPGERPVEVISPRDIQQKLQVRPAPLGETIVIQEDDDARFAKGFRGFSEVLREDGTTPGAGAYGRRGRDVVPGVRQEERPVVAPIRTRVSRTKSMPKLKKPKRSSR